MLTSEPASRRKPRLPLVPGADLLDPLPEPLGGDVVAEAVAGGVVGDRQVGVAALAAGLGHLLERVAAVGERGVGVQVAADVVERDQLRQLALARRLQLAAALAQLRLDVGVAEALVDLSSVSQSSTSPLSTSVIPCSETERPRATASSRSCDVVGLGAGEVLEQVAEGVRGDDPQVDRDRRCGSGRGRRWGPALPAAAISGWAARCSASAVGSSAVAIRSMSLQVSAQRRTEPATSTRLAAGCSRSAAASSSAIGRTVESSRRPGPSPGSPSRSSAARTFSSTFGPRPFELADLARPRPPPCRSSSDGDSELVVEPSRGLRPQPRDPRHLDQGRRELRLQLHRGRDLAGLQQRVDLFRQRLADAGNLGRPARGGELGDRDRALADRLGRGAVGEHAVFDRAVELVEDSQLVERGGDLGVGHSLQVIAARRAGL